MELMVSGISTKLVWLPAGHPENPFSYEVLDCRAYALSVKSVTDDPVIALKFAQLRTSDGRELRGQSPKGAQAIPGKIRIPGHYMLDGPLYVASEMEHKWDFFAYDSRLYARRSWSGDLIHTAAITTLAEELVLESIQSNTSDVLAEIELLVSWYIARRPFPFLIPADLFETKDDWRPAEDRVENLEMLIALWGFQAYGPIAQYGRRIVGPDRSLSAGAPSASKFT